jgi:hypothetical protein
MSDAVLVALIVAGLGSLTTLLPLLITERSRRAARREDWAREDAVAAKAAEAAALLLAANAEVATTAATANQKLDVIHGLVNSNMTAAMQAELDARDAQLVVMREVAELHRAAGREPTQTSMDAIAAITAKTHELRSTLADRLE